MSNRQIHPKMRSVINMLLKTLSLSLMAFAVTAHADIHGTATFTTNYIWRMFSKSNGKPAVQGNLDYQHSSGVYLGASASNFNFGKSEAQVSQDFAFPGSAQVEVSPYIGFTHKIAEDWRLDLQYNRYFYDGTIFSNPADYNEFYVFLHYKDMLSVQGSFIDDMYGLGGEAYFAEITGRYPITDYLEFSTGFGYARTKAVYESDYRYWNVGLTARYKFVSADLRYHDAYEDYFIDDLGEKFNIDHPITIKPTVVFSISLGF